VLQQPVPPSLDDNFFRSGGTSLRAAVLAAKLTVGLGRRIDVTDVLRAPTLGELTALVGDGAVDGPLAGVATDAVSLQQERRLRQAVTSASVRRKSIDVVFDLHGPLDLGALRSALAAVVNRHALLRGRYERDGDGFRLVTDVRPELRVAEVDAETAETRVTEIRAQGFDLWAGPLASFDLLVIAEQLHVLVVRADHSIIDGWSFQVILDDLSAAYTLAVSGARPVELAPMTTTYGQFVAYQRAQMTSAGRPQLVDFWRGYLHGTSPAVRFPQVSDVADGDYRGYGVALRLPDGLTADVETLAADLGATPFILWGALLVLVAHEIAEQDDLVMHASTANRPGPEFEAVVGNFAHRLMLRSRRPTGDESLRDYVDTVRESWISAMGHQQLPYVEIVREVFPDEYLRAHSDPHLYFSVASAPLLILDGTGVDARRPKFISSDPGISVWIEPRPDGDMIQMSCPHNVEETVAAVMAERLRDAATSAVRRPESTVTEIAPWLRCHVRP
jgi:hypothetical protein